jgi:hypothetical protein
MKEVNETSDIDKTTRGTFEIEYNLLKFRRPYHPKHDIRCNISQICFQYWSYRMLRGSVITPASHTGSPAFEIRFRLLAILRRFSWFSSVAGQILAKFFKMHYPVFLFFTYTCFM